MFVTRYNLFDFFFFCGITVVILVFSPNKLIVALILGILLIATIYRCFRKFELSEDGFKRKTVIGSQKYSWNDVKSIELNPGVKTINHFFIHLKNDKKLKGYWKYSDKPEMLKILNKGGVKVIGRAKDAI